MPSGGLISSGFRVPGTQDPEYDPEALTSAGQKHHGAALGEATLA